MVMPRFSIEYTTEKELPKEEQDRIVARIHFNIKQEKRIKFLKQFARLSLEEQASVMKELNKEDF
jgi:hypothetical protein